MNNIIKYAVSFVIGAGSGIAASYIFFKKKHEKELTEQVAAIKAACNKNLVEEKKQKNNIKRDDIREYKKTASMYADVKSSDRELKPSKATEKKHDDFYVIDPCEYGEEPGYGVVSLTYCADGYLIDDNGETIEDYTELVGSDFAKHFGEYEDDSVYIRNDAKKCDYEILKSLKTYKDFLYDNPFSAEEEE